MFSFGKTGINVSPEVGTLIFAVVLAVLLWVFLRKVGNSKNVDESEGSVGANRVAEEPDADEDDFDGFDGTEEDALPDATVYHNARIVNMECGYDYRRYFRVTFALEDGEELTLGMEEDEYNAMNEGQTGDLVVIGECFLGFD